mgnify:CR=1 FL=1
MKRLLTLLMAVLMLGTLTIPVFADGNTTTLTTTVPEAEYTLTIPADMEISYGTETVVIGEIKATSVSGFTVGKGLKVKIEHTEFTCSGVETTIPFQLAITASADNPIDNIFCSPSSGSFSLTFRKRSGEAILKPTVKKTTTTWSTYGEAHVLFKAKSSDWANALAGNYNATLTFSSEVVVVAEG